jgi:AraC-like DNA-binding protein
MELNVWPSIIGKNTASSSNHSIGGGVTAPHIITKGSGWIQTKNRRKKLNTGDMFCVMKNGQIEFYNDNNEPWCFFWMKVFGEVTDLLVESWGFTNDEPWLTPREPQKAIESFTNIYEMGKSKKVNSNLLAIEMFKLSNAINKPKTHKKTRSQQITDQAKVIIESQLHTGMNVEELAENLKLDRSTLFCAFKKEYKCSPIEYLREQRIKRACQILRNSNHNLTDIARMCGFSSDKYLIKTFKNLRGTTPHKYIASK